MRKNNLLIPSLQHRLTRTDLPNHDVGLEWEGVHCLSTLANPDTMIPEANSELAEWQAYGQSLAKNKSCNV